MKKKPTTKTLSIQRRVYPKIVQAVEDEALRRKTTPTKTAAAILSDGLGLPQPVRKNASQKQM